MASEEEIERLCADVHISLEMFENPGRWQVQALLMIVARQSAEIAELRHLRDGLMAASNNAAAEMAELRRSYRHANDSNEDALRDVRVLRSQLTAIVGERDTARAELAEAKLEAASVKEWADRAACNYRVQHAEMSATIDSLRADLERAEERCEQQARLRAQETQVLQAQIKTLLDPLTRAAALAQPVIVLKGRNDG